MHRPEMCGDCWFLHRVMSRLVERYRNVVFMERPIRKEPLFRCLSWWFRLGKQESKHVLRLMTRNFDGVVYSHDGLHIPKSYLLAHQGGDPRGVGA